MAKVGNGIDTSACGIVKPVVTSRNLWFHAYTAFLFTKSDFKCIIAPQSVFAIAAALTRVDFEPTAVSRIAFRLPQMLVWLWIHLFVADVSNQRRASSVIEDALNKPWRPIPSGRISPEEATRVLYVAVPMAVLLSVTMVGIQGLAPSIVLLTLLWLYNDFDFPAGKAFPAWRNALNGLGIASFGWGATMALGPKDLPPPFTWLAVTAAVTCTTIQSQDLPDMEGDAARNRSTLPLVFGESITRWSIAVFALVWSLVCPKLWQVPPMSIGRFIPLGIALYKAVLVTRCRYESSDKVVWKLWGAWVAAIYVLPLFKGNFV